MTKNTIRIYTIAFEPFEVVHVCNHYNGLLPHGLLFMPDMGGHMTAW